jgi:hypothetical protein
MSQLSELLRLAEQDPSAADFAALRAAYRQDPDYRTNIKKHISQAKLMQITDAAKDFAEVAATCQGLLQANPLDLEARMLLAHAQEKQGQSEAAEKNHRFAERMLDAILATGDGKSAERPFILLAENEAWTVMRSFGIKAKEHLRQAQEERILDIFQGRIGEREVSIFFDVTAPARVVDENIPPA